MNVLREIGGDAANVAIRADLVVWSVFGHSSAAAGTSAWNIAPGLCLSDLRRALGSSRRIIDPMQAVASPEMEVVS
jgi:hypothetical protein